MDNTPTKLISNTAKNAKSALAYGLVTSTPNKSEKQTKDLPNSSHALKAINIQLRGNHALLSAVNYFVLKLIYIPAVLTKSLFNTQELVR